MYSVSNPIPKLLIVGALGVFSAACLLSCGSDLKPTEPDASATADLSGIEDEGLSLGAGEHPGHRGFFPLAIGNSWQYKHDIVQYLEPNSHDSIWSGPAWVSQYWNSRELVGTEGLFGREYVVEEQRQWGRLTIGVPDTSYSWVYYRQDRAGLYEADVAFRQPQNSKNGPPAGFGAAATATEEPLSSRLRQRGKQLTAAQAAACDAAMAKLEDKMAVVRAALSWHGHHPPGRFDGRRGGALDNEITRLKYPVRPVQRWIIREDPLFTSRVMGHDLLRLPAGRLAGYRIRIESSLFGPEDRVLVWYGRAGLLRMSAHMESTYPDYEDPYGEIPTVIVEELSTLETFELVGR